MGGKLNPFFFPSKLTKNNYINLDAPVLQQQRRTRSGKNFDAIGVGKESWRSEERRVGKECLE